MGQRMNCVAGLVGDAYADSEGLNDFHAVFFAVHVTSLLPLAILAPPERSSFAPCIHIPTDYGFGVFDQIGRLISIAPERHNKRGSVAFGTVLMNEVLGQVRVGFF